MTLLPKTPPDMALAPVAVHVDQNLRRLRDRPEIDIEYELQLELDTPLFTNTREERAEHVLRVAQRDVDMHGWTAAITDDGCRLRLSGGSVTLDLGLSASVMRYIQVGLAVAAA